VKGRLHGRVAVVTGGGGGVGRGLARALAAHGASVVVAARRRETGDVVVQEIVDRGGSAVCVEADVGTRTGVEEAVGTAVDLYGGLDIMVHNAVHRAAQERVALDDFTEDLWNAIAGVSLRGSYLCAQVALSHLRPNRGRLILITSTAGIEGSAALPLYSAVKAGQRALAKSLAREWGPLGITANCIAPVAASTGYEIWAGNNPEVRDRVLSRIPLGRIGDPELDIGPVAVFLASDESRYVTGQTIVADGGGFTGL
jgi:NAD(P)-dependent dehydrogenase (short-subunit alcohol dehydrogenase family)